MDWKTWVAVGFSIIGLFLWQYYYAQNLTQQQLAAPPQVQQTHANAERGNGSHSSLEGVPSASSTGVPAAAAAVAPQTAANNIPILVPRTESLQAGKAEYVFNNDTGGIEQVNLLLHLGENHDTVSLNRDRKMPIGAIGGEAGVALGGFEMETDPANLRVVFSKTEADGLKIRKTFTLPPADDPTREYIIGLKIEFENPGKTEIQRLGYFVSAGGAAPIHVTDMPHYTRFDWAREGKMHSIDVNWFSPSQVPLLGIPLRGAREIYTEARDKISWVAVSSQYFCTIVTSPDNEGLAVWARRFDTKKQNNTPVYGIQGAIGLPGFKLGPGESRGFVLDIYAGPKELSRLNRMQQGQAQIMNFGMFGIVSEFLLWAMNSLHSVLGNYAAAIIALTLIIKTVLWPVQNKATQSMRKMALLSPKMNELREKYKDNPQKMNEELLKLYKDYGINPFSGCLPMLIQIPIFFGFYSMLGVAIELRNASFLWIHDLSQPDTIAHVMNFPINLLPIIMAATMVWQMAITPKSGDKMQQRILYIMPVIFLVFCYNFASALSLYWTTQNIFSIMQLYLTRNQPLPVLEKKSVVAKREAQAAKKSRKKAR
jgi:YidC/Oxa1 family membrane protein insertase